MKHTAVGYTRVSTDRQADKGISLEAQKERIKAQAKASGYSITDVIADAGASGKSLSRPGMQQLIHRLADIDAVIVWKLDRLTRSVHDLLAMLELFQQNKVRLISITESLDTESASGRMVLTILAAVAQMEREQIAERIRLAASHYREQRLAWGNIPFGFKRSGKRIVKSKRDIAQCRRAVELRAAGHTYEAIGKMLNRSHQHVHRMVTIWAKRLGIETRKRQAIRVVKRGYRTDRPAHYRARMKVAPSRRREIAMLGAAAMKIARAKTDE
jgi:DNA invertase Pin-like site-specific DNA recombinase